MGLQKPLCWCRKALFQNKQRFFKKKYRYEVISGLFWSWLSIYKRPPDSFSDQGRIGLECLADLRQSHNDPRKQNLAGKLPGCLRFPLPLNQRKARLAEGQVVLPKFLLLLTLHQRHRSDSYPKLYLGLYIYQIPNIFFFKWGALQTNGGALQTNLAKKPTSAFCLCQELRGTKIRPLRCQQIRFLLRWELKKKGAWN